MLFLLKKIVPVVLSKFIYYLKFCKVETDLCVYLQFSLTLIKYRNKIISTYNSLSKKFYMILYVF